MPAPYPHDLETVERFRAHYLYSGNASESAREVGIPESTGREMARRLSAESSFVADRRTLRANALEELIAMRMRVAAKALEEFDSGAPDVVVTEKGAVFPPDRRPDFGKLVLEAEKNAQHLAKVEGGDGTDKPRPTAIEIIAREDDDDGGNDPGVE